MVVNRDIVIIGIQSWDIKIGSNCKNLAWEFAKQNRVLYVNPPLDRAEKIRKYLQIQRRMNRKDSNKTKSGNLEKITENFWVLNPAMTRESINRIPSYSVFSLLNRLNTKRFSREIKKVLKTLNFQNFILFNDSSMILGEYIKEYLQPSIYIYYIRDFLILHPYWKKHGTKSEPAVIKKADLVLTNSEVYRDYALQFNSQSYMVGQGCDISILDKVDEIEIPEGLLNMNGIKIGYVGYLTGGRLDINLIEFIARERPQWNIVLVGPEDERFRRSRLHGIPNIKFLGPVTPESVPAYIKGFDVAINPQVITPVTDGNYPRKIDEYLLLGKPVVCSATRAMRYFEDTVYVAGNYHEFLEKIEIALQENSTLKINKRVETARNHSWANNVEEIYRRIIQFEEKRKYEKESHSFTSN